ncbi:MAG: PAS domain-containing protein, partial [Anaerolineaceae bacterium]
FVAPSPAPQAAVPAAQPAAGSQELPLNTGALTLKQIDLLLTHLPVDVTFVDENDEVRYFSQTRERIFARTPAIIGRKVQNCHPPQSVHRVTQIVDDFRSGARDSAEFWIQMGPKFVHIAYYAIRDEDGKYRGTLEVSQDAAHLRSLEGERRLLDGVTPGA